VYVFANLSSILLTFSELGGDGTVLYASWLFQRIVPPVLAFAMGSLGFLTKFDFDKHPDILNRAIAEGLTVSLRLRFEATVMRSQDRSQKERDLVEELIGEESEDHHTHRPDGTHNILNEVVLDRGPNASTLILTCALRMLKRFSDKLSYVYS
jgi:NAD+ kinase